VAWSVASVEQSMLDMSLLIKRALPSVFNRHVPDFVTLVATYSLEAFTMKAGQFNPP
jgi:hypothetical protein